MRPQNTASPQPTPIIEYVTTWGISFNQLLKLCTVVDCQLLRANCEHIRALEKTLIIALFHVTEETPKFPNKPINHYNFSAYL